jgi:hypothetical protein
MGAKSGGRYANVKRRLYRRNVMLRAAYGASSKPRSLKQIWFSDPTPLLWRKPLARDEAHPAGTPAACVILKEGGSSGSVGGTMNASDPVYLELVDFVAGGTTPEDVIDFHPSAEAQERLAELIERERRSQLTPAETSELSHFLELEHILRMAKAKARLILANRS